MKGMTMLLLGLALVVCSVASGEKNQADPESAMLQAQKAHKLAPYNGGNGVSCARLNPNNGNTCIFKGSFCGYYCECPKCVCIDENEVGVELPDGTRKCMEGNIGPALVRYGIDDDMDGGTTPQVERIGSSASNLAENGTTGAGSVPQPTGGVCQVSSQCKGNLQCTAVTGTYTKHCLCEFHKQWDNNLEKCVAPFAEGEPCQGSLGCGSFYDSAARINQGLFCNQNQANVTMLNRCNRCLPNCAECDRGTKCIRCAPGFRIEADPSDPNLDICSPCFAPNCARCESQSVTGMTPEIRACEECLPGFFKDGTNQYTCALKVDYQKTCKGEMDECRTKGSECRTINGAKLCTCKAGYTWNPSGGFCVHPDANLNVEVNRTCKYDRSNFVDVFDFENDGYLQVCKAGLECVDSCSPCAGCGGMKVCVTKIDYKAPPCYGDMRNWLSDGGTLIQTETSGHTGSSAGDEDDHSSASHSLGSLLAIVASLAFAASL